MPEGWPTPEMKEIGNKLAASYGIYSAVWVFQAMIEAAPTPPAPEDEPIYQYQLPTGLWVDYRPEHSTGLDAYPQRVLYAYPTSDKLRQAAEEALKMLQELDQFHSLTPFGQEVIENLRAALEETK